MKHMYKVLLCIFAALFGGHAYAVEARIAEGPYLQAVNEHGFTVVWTSRADAVGWIEIAPDDGTPWYSEERPRFYNTVDGIKAIGCVHRVTVGGLEAGTTYRYRILCQQYSPVEGKYRMQAENIYASAIFRSQPFNVRTLDPNKKKFRFAVVNDIHEDDSLFRILIKPIAKEIDFLVLNGDMNSFIHHEAHLFDGYLRSAAEISAGGVPIFMARGNHETRGLFAHRYMDYFPSVTGKPYYHFRHGPAFFIVLDSAEDKPDSDIEYDGLADFDRYRHVQAQWLSGVIASDEFKSAPVKIVVIHIPPARKGWHGPREAYRLFASMLNGTGIDLMLCGHTKGRYIEPDQDCDFPILINEKTNRAIIDVDERSIIVKTSDRDGLNGLDISLRSKSTVVQ